MVSVLYIESDGTSKNVYSGNNIDPPTTVH